MELAFQNLLSALVLAVVTILVFSAKQGISLGMKYLEAKMGLQNTVMLKDFVSTIVRFLEQSPVFKKLTGADKKERAISEIITWAEARGIPIDRAYIDKLIEEAVQVMKTEKIDLFSDIAVGE
jgi:hypothetical protein